MLRTKRKPESCAASLAEIMTAPPTPIEQHAEVLRRRTEARRKVEEIVERRRLERDAWSI